MAVFCSTILMIIATRLWFCICRRTSTHPDSLFVRQMVVTVPKSWGRATLLSDENGNVVLKMKRRGERSQVVQLQTEAERILALKEHFGIVLL